MSPCRGRCLRRPMRINKHAVGYINNENEIMGGLRVRPCFIGDLYDTKK